MASKKPTEKATERDTIERAVGGRGKPELVGCHFIQQPGNAEKRNECPEYPSKRGTLCRFCGFKTPGHRGQVG